MIKGVWGCVVLIFGVTLAVPVVAEPQAFEGRPHGGQSAGDMLLHRHGLTAAQYEKMRAKEVAPRRKPTSETQR